MAETTDRRTPVRSDTAVLPGLKPLVRPYSRNRPASTNSAHVSGQQVRADWVERELPERVDPEEHGGLLALLRLDPADLVDAPSP
ncbi:hypothetical protein [Micromonospora sp. NPDC003776]